jgi:hypothetical protein
VATGLEHQGMPDPVEFAEKMLAFFAHVGAHQIGAAACYEPDGVATGVCVDAEEGFYGHFYEFVENADLGF